MSEKVKIKLLIAAVFSVITLPLAVMAEREQPGAAKIVIGGLAFAILLSSVLPDGTGGDGGEGGVF